MTNLLAALVAAFSVLVPGPPPLPPVEVQRASPDWEGHWKAGKQAYWGRKYREDVDRRQRVQESRRDEAGTGKDSYGETGKSND